MRQPEDAFRAYRDKAAEYRGATYASKRRRRDPVDPAIDPWRLPLERINVANPALFKADLVEPYFARLRAEAPVHYCAESQYGPYWSITRFRDILAIDSDPARFSSDARSGGVAITGTAQSGEFIPMFIQSDPPRHDRQRAAVAPRFAPSRLAELEATIRGWAGAILDQLPRGETFDWVQRVAKPLTGQMLATLLGLPVNEWQRLVAWSDILANPDNPEIVPSPAVFYDTLADMGEFFAARWNDALAPSGGSCAAVDPGPGSPHQPTLDPVAPDLIAMLAHGAGTRDMGPRELVGNMLLLIQGGNDTTRNSITGGLLALHRFPDQFALLRANPGLIPNMVSEIIRWQTPLAHMARTATCDVTLHGQTIRAGDRVILWYLSGNRDETVIPDAHAFIIDRPNARHHLSFGFGVHRCLGNRLAEMQLRVLWEEILARRLDLRVEGPAERISSCFFRGFSQLPVSIYHAPV